MWKENLGVTNEIRVTVNRTLCVCWGRVGSISEFTLVCLVSDNCRTFE